MTDPVWIVGDADGVTDPAHATQELAQDAAEAIYRKHNADIRTFDPTLTWQQHRPGWLSMLADGEPTDLQVQQLPVNGGAGK